jgi:hypothetical protein
MQATKSLSHRHLGPQVLATLASVVVSALLVFGSATDQAAAKGGGGVFRGTTSQGYPGYVKTSSFGYLIDKATIPVLVKCSFGPMLLPQKFEFVTVAPNGRFKETGSGAAEEEGLSLQFTESLSGRFDKQRTSVVTKSRIHLVFHAPDGSAEECDSGVVTMHAHV